MSDTHREKQANGQMGGVLIIFYSRKDTVSVCSASFNFQVSVLPEHGWASILCLKHRGTQQCHLNFANGKQLFT